MDSWSTGTYRCCDPIRNFRIRIKLQKARLEYVSAHESGEKGDGEDIPLSELDHTDQEVEEREFTWQEKVFSPREIHKYQQLSNCHTALEEKYHQDVMAMEKDQDPRRLFSYVDADSYINSKEVSYKVTTDSKETPSFLVEKMAGLRQRKNTKQREPDSLQKPVIGEEDYISDVQIMYIMADLNPKSVGYHDKRKEQVLCRLEYNSKGVLIVYPDFNSRQAGHKIQLDTVTRDVYEYWVEHASGDINENERAKERNATREIYERSAEQLQRRIGRVFDTPPPGKLFLSVSGEISLAKDYEYEPLHVHYYIDLPKGWTKSANTKLVGVTQSCNIASDHDGREVARFGFPFTLELTLDLGDGEEKTAIPKWPLLYVKVASLDSWGRYRIEGYGHMRIPSTPGSHNVGISTWRPTDTSLFPIGEMRRFFIGGSPELEDITYVGVPHAFEGKYLSRLGFRTVGSGSVLVHMNILHQSQAYVGLDKDRGSRHMMLAEKLSSGTLLHSVNAVLEAYRRAKERLSRAKQGLPEPEDDKDD